MGGLRQGSSAARFEHFNSLFYPSRLKIQFHDHLPARAMFNNSQLCSQAPSPQLEPCPMQPEQTPDARPSAQCVFSHLDIIDEHAPHFSRLHRQDLCCFINNKTWYCPGGGLLCVSRCSLSLQFVTQFTQTCRMPFHALFLCCV